MYSGNFTAEICPDSSHTRISDKKRPACAGPSEGRNYAKSSSHLLTTFSKKYYNNDEAKR